MTVPEPPTCSGRSRAALGLVLVLAICSSPSHGGDAPPDFVEVGEGAYVLSKPDLLADFHLIRHDNTPFANAALVGRWSFIFFGYTHCPDVCPTTLASMKEIRRSLESRQPPTKDVQFVFVSIDPERDSPDRLAEYVGFFDREFIGVTGERTALSNLADSVGVVYSKVSGAMQADYLMDHSSALLLTDPESRLHAVFAAPHIPDQILRAFAKIRARVQARARPGAEDPAVTE